MTKYRRIKQRVFEIISKAEDGDHASRIFDWTIVVLITLSILSIILESFPYIRVGYYYHFKVFETVTVIIFTAEYILRIWTADLLYPDSKHPRLKYIFSPMAIIDLIAILPFYVPFFSGDLRFLRMMRLFRLIRILRIFKLGRYFDALQTIFTVIKTSGPQLIMSVALCFFVMLFSAIVMYTVENKVQPEQFPNVISSLWWAMCTLTTVGYGDVYPITPVGKFFASVISLVGIGIIAIPTGIIAAGFNHVITNQEQRLLPEKEAVISSLETMNEDELLEVQAKLSDRLRDFGCSTTITIGAREKTNREDDSRGSGTAPGDLRSLPPD